MKVNKMKWYIIWTIIWISIWATFFTYWWALDSFTGMTQTWFEAVKTKLNWTYTSGKMCTSDGSWQIQCITTIPEAGANAAILTKLCQSVWYDWYNANVWIEGCTIEPTLSDWWDVTNSPMRYLLANRPATQFTWTLWAANFITDNVTWLMWESVPPTVTSNWDGAKAYCAFISLWWYTDWRLPDINELASIVDHSYSSGNYWYESFFTLGANRYRSSTTNAITTVNARDLNLSDASTSSNNKGNGIRTICTR